METWNPSNIKLHRQHVLQIGTVLAHAEGQGQVIHRNISIEGTSGPLLLRTIAYDGNGADSLSELESTIYAEDHWILNSRVAVDTGMRWGDAVSYPYKSVPRRAPALPGHPARITPLSFAVVSGSSYDSLPLNTYAFSRYPEQIVTTYDGRGSVTDGP
jgi:hypothetical protein